MKTDTVFEAVKDWVSAAAPAFVTQQDLARLEGRIDELQELVDAVEQKVVANKGRQRGKPQGE